MSRKYHSKSKPGEVKAMIGQGLNVSIEDIGGEETLISGPDSERAYDILKAKGDDVFEQGSSSINEKRNSAFDEAKAYIGKALKEGGYTRNAVAATIMNYGLTQSEAQEMLDIYGNELKNVEPAEFAELSGDIKETKREIAEAQASGDKSKVIELQKILKDLQDRYDGLKKKENKNAIGHKPGDEVDIETTGMASVGQKKQYNDGEGNNWWVEVTKVTKEGYIGNIIGKVGGTVNSTVTTDEERRNLGKDLYGSNKNADAAYGISKGMKVKYDDPDTGESGEGVMVNYQDDEYEIKTTEGKTIKVYKTHVEKA